MPRRCERVRERASGGGGRAVRAGERETGDRERRQRPRLDAEVGRLPAGRVAARVEVRVVAEHAACDAPDPRRGELAREAVEVCASERRIAEADEPEVARSRRAPTRDPAPTTSVRKRKRGPRTRSAANETASFSADAGGASGWRSSRRPTRPSRGRRRAPPFGRGSMPGARSARRARRRGQALAAWSVEAVGGGNGQRDDQRRPRLHG